MCAQERLSPWPHCRTPQQILHPPKTRGSAPIHVHPMAKVTPRPQYIFQLPQISGTPEITETRDKLWRASEVGEESHMGTFSGSLSSRVGTVGRIYRGPQEASGRRWDGPAVAFTEGCLKDHKPEQELSGRGARRRSAFPQRVCPLGTHWLLSLAFPGFVVASLWDSIHCGSCQVIKRVLTQAREGCWARLIHLH